MAFRIDRLACAAAKREQKKRQQHGRISDGKSSDDRLGMNFSPGKT